MGGADVVLGVQWLQSLGTKLLKKEQRGVIAQLCSLDVSTSESSISPDLQKVLDNHSKVFETPKGLTYS